MVISHREIDRPAELVYRFGFNAAPPGVEDSE